MGPFPVTSHPRGNGNAKKRKLLLPKSASASHESVQAVSPESPSHPWDHGILGGADVTGVYVCMCWCQQGGRSSAPLCPFPMGIGGQLGYLRPCESQVSDQLTPTACHSWHSAGQSFHCSGCLVFMLSSLRFSTCFLPLFFI